MSTVAKDAEKAFSEWMNGVVPALRPKIDITGIDKIIDPAMRLEEIKTKTSAIEGAKTKLSRIIDLQQAGYEFLCNENGLKCSEEMVKPLDKQSAHVKWIYMNLDATKKQYAQMCTRLSTLDGKRTATNAAIAREEERAKKLAEEIAAKLAERKKAEEEAERKKAEEAAAKKKLAEEEAERKKAEEAAAKKKLAEEEAERKKAEEAAAIAAKKEQENSKVSDNTDDAFGDAWELTSPVQTQPPIQAPQTPPPTPLTSPTPLSPKPEKEKAKKAKRKREEKSDSPAKKVPKRRKSSASTDGYEKLVEKNLKPFASTVKKIKGKFPDHHTLANHVRSIAPCGGLWKPKDRVSAKMSADCDDAIAGLCAVVTEQVVERYARTVKLVEATECLF